MAQKNVPPKAPTADLMPEWRHMSYTSTANVVSSVKARGKLSMTGFRSGGSKGNGTLRGSGFGGTEHKETAEEVKDDGLKSFGGTEHKTTTARWLEGPWRHGAQDELARGSGTEHKTMKKELKGDEMAKEPLEAPDVVEWTVVDG